MLKKIDIFELLKKDSKEEIKKFLIANGKAGKEVCPVIFDVENIKENNLKKEED